MESRKSVQNLAKSIRSLLGLKTHLTSSWADSVCNIIRDLPSEEPSNGSQIKWVDFETMGSFDNKEVDLGVAVSKIQDELAALNSDLNQLNLQRRQALNDFLDLKGNIRVFCRVRPITIGENVGCFGPVVASDSSTVLLKLAENKSKAYSFDKVFHPGSSQDEVFAEVEPVIKSTLDGYNTCIFAYGQTGTGKTFTMEGTAGCLGVVPRAIEALFKQAVDSNHAFLFSFSMLEIYMGNLKDLLVPQPTKPTDPLPPCLSIQTDPRGRIEIDNLVAIRVSDFHQAIRLYRLGSQFRSTASTNSNVASSRSHCLIRISLTCFNAPERRRETNKLWMVDLGGSERVLKTKAWGRRFEEGKAINLSLSALGDVISALQRRKAHIPYRNSKLTRVLKDSLGEDSKTLMLVHVSPKEEDLCETICSLNFATRVRNIRLENQESTQEVRDQKEVAMTKLLQKVKQIEYERQDMRRDIDKLNEKIQHLTRTVPTSNGYLKLPHLLNEVPQSNTEMENHSIGDVIAAPSLQLPRFMRPTICSRRKSDTDPQTLESAQKKDSSLPRRRKASSVHAESITFSIKGILEYDSECSTSRTSCLVGLNMKCSTDYGTEYSHDASECDIKTVVFPEQEKSPRRLAHSKDHFSHKSTNRYGNRKANKFYSTKCLTIDNWLHLQRNESTTRTYTHRTKKVLAIPVPEKNNRCNGQNKAEILQCVKVHNHEVTNENIFNHDKIEKLVDVGVTGRSNTEEVIDETWNSGFNIISPFIMTDEKVMEETQGLLGDLMIKDNGCSPISPPDMQYDRLNQNEYSGVTGMTSKQEVTAETQNMSEDFMLEDSGCNPSSPSEMENNIIKLKEESHDPASKPELESGSQQWSTEIPNQAMVGPRRTVVIDDTVLMEITLSNGNMSKEYSDKGDLCAGFQYVEGVTRPCLHTMRSCRVLFMDYANLKDPTTSFIESQERIHNTGIFDFVGQKLKILYASALLGLGVQSLGLGHDFFYGLML